MYVCKYIYITEQHNEPNASSMVHSLPRTDRTECLSQTLRWVCALPIPLQSCTSLLQACTNMPHDSHMLVTWLQSHNLQNQSYVLSADDMCCPFAEETGVRETNQLDGIFQHLTLVPSIVRPTETLKGGKDQQMLHSQSVHMLHTC